MRDGEACQYFGALATNDQGYVASPHGDSRCFTRWEDFFETLSGPHAMTVHPGRVPICYGLLWPDHGAWLPLGDEVADGASTEPRRAGPTDEHQPDDADNGCDCGSKIRDQHPSHILGRFRLPVAAYFAGRCVAVTR
jgi:hypothetical protein